MESLNQTIKNILHFIKVIQNACDNKRLSIEKDDLQKYDTFVKEWKNEKSVKVSPKKADPLYVEEKPAEAALEDEMEELALVDKLLEKARNIRLKNEALLKKSENFTKTSCVVELSNNISKSNNESQLHRVFSKRVVEPSSHKRTIPRSKSASISTKLNTCVVPRSKSANIRHLLNGEEKVQKNHRTATRSNSKYGGMPYPSWQNNQVTTDASNVAIISNNELSEFKKMHSGQNYRKKKTFEKIQSTAELYKTSSSDFKQYSDQPNAFPTYRRFQKESQRISSSKSSFRMHIYGLWYPFLSLKSRNYLLDRSNVSSFNSFTKAVQLIHQIQETMLWIDLLSMVGRETLPSLCMLDENDWNAIRLCSYLESIYHENLQRAPILDTNR